MTNANTAFRAIGDENAALDRALELLPDTLRKANTTFVNLRSTLDDLDKLVDVLEAGHAPSSPRSCASCARCVHEARPTIADLNTLVRQPGANNDLIELTAKQPRLADLTESVFPRAIQHARPRPAGVRVRAQLHARPRRLAHELRPAGRQLRRQRPLRARAADVPARPRFSGGTLTANQPSQKLDGFDTGNLTRCPGAIMQPAPDGSSPVPVGGDCDPSRPRPAHEAARSG